MKIDKNNLLHWAYLAWVGFIVLLFLPLRLIRKRGGSKAVILYGHKLHGNLNAIYEYALKNREALEDLQIFFLTMDPDYYGEIKSQPNILFALNPFALTRVILADCIISDHGLHALQLLFKLSDMKFTDVWHGIPFKGFTGDDFILQRQYDETWVSAKLLQKLYVDRFSFDEDKVYVTGYGRTDLILGYHVNKSQIREKLGIPIDKKVILFAPTWKQDEKNRDEIPFNFTQDNFLKSLEDFAANNNAFLIIRYHLNSVQGGLIDNQNVLHMPLQKYPNGEELLAVTDVLITDWSSIAFDMMVLDKPIIFLEVPPPFKNGFSLPPDYRVGDLVENMTELIESLSKACFFEESYWKKYDDDYQRIKKLVYDDTLDGQSTDRYFSRLKKMLGE